MLDKATLTRLEAVLARRRTALEQEIRAKLASAREVAGSAALDQVIESGDYANADLIAALDIAEVQRDLVELRELNSACARMAAGDYGACADCGVDIPRERLEAYPVAIRCTPCQARAERRAATSRPRL
jgi:RNA polymerase-binding transcription factor DksA